MKGITIITESADLKQAPAADGYISTGILRSANKGGVPVSPSEFVRDAETDRVLTTMVLNIQTMQRLVNLRFQGRPGFGRKTEKAAA